MEKRRQRPIPVTSREREFLDQYKKRYEKSTGDTGDWGNFLSTITLLGLAAAGIYMSVKAAKETANSASTQCGVCGQTFLIAISDQVGRAVHVNCPHCQAELVVDLVETKVYR